VNTNVYVLRSFVSDSALPHDLLTDQLKTMPQCDTKGSQSMFDY